MWGRRRRSLLANAHVVGRTAHTALFVELARVSGNADEMQGVARVEARVGQRTWKRRRWMWRRRWRRRRCSAAHTIGVRCTAIPALLVLTTGFSRDSHECQPIAKCKLRIRLRTRLKPHGDRGWRSVPPKGARRWRRRFDLVARKRTLPQHVLRVAQLLHQYVGDASHRDAGAVV